MKTMKPVKNYRNIIISIASRYAQPGEDLEQSILAGAPKIVDADEATGIADWLSEIARNEWGPDQRHERIAREIREAVVTPQHIARSRVQNSQRLSRFEKIIFADWSNWDEHIDWVITAPVSEIVDWAETIILAEDSNGKN